MDQELQQKAELLAASRRTLLVDAACAERTLHYMCTYQMATAALFCKK